MEQKPKPKKPWLVLIWLLWSLIAPGCAQFPNYTFDDCVTAYSDAPELAEACKTEAEKRTNSELRREERKMEKARCVVPHVWVEPPGYCTPSSMIY